MAGTAIEIVAHDRVSGRREMDPQLMGPAGLGAECHQCHVRRHLERPIGGPRRFSLRVHPHPPPVFTVGSEGKLEAPLARPRVTPDHGQVGLLHPPLAEGPDQVAVSLGPTSQENQPGGADVEPMDEQQLAFGKSLPIAFRQGADEATNRRPWLRCSRREADPRGLGDRDE
jgi:hypothetical protein